MAESPARGEITGAVLAGGRGLRLGGVEKGLLTWQGQPLAARALDRLAPQVGPRLLVANRQTQAYRAFGVPVHADIVDGQPGPLAGLLTALAHAPTDWVLAVPCDVPDFPLDLAARLLAAVASGPAHMAIACAERRHPVFCLLHRSLQPTLAASLAGGERRVDHWARAQGAALAQFDDEAAFRNLNTPEDWAPAEA